MNTTSQIPSAIVLIALIGAITFLVTQGDILSAAATGFFGVVLGHVGTLTAVNTGATNSK